MVPAAGDLFVVHMAMLRKGEDKIKIHDGVFEIKHLFLASVFFWGHDLFFILIKLHIRVIHRPGKGAIL